MSNEGQAISLVSFSQWKSVIVVEEQDKNGQERSGGMQ